MHDVGGGNKGFHRNNGTQWEGENSTNLQIIKAHGNAASSKANLSVEKGKRIPGGKKGW